MASIFSRIISGEIPGHIVAENGDFVAFLDINPLVMGHVLVVPKKEIDYLFDLPEDLLASIMPFAATIAAKIRLVVPCQRIGIAVIGLEVPHAHIHLVPLQTVSDINFSRPKLNPSSEELKVMAEKIRSAAL